MNGEKFDVSCSNEQGTNEDVRADFDLAAVGETTRLAAGARRAQVGFQEVTAPIAPVRTATGGSGGGANGGPDGKPTGGSDGRGPGFAQKAAKVKAALRAQLGEDVYTSWFASLEFASFDGHCLKTTVPVKFLKNWIQTHYADALLACAGREFQGVAVVDVSLREPNAIAPKPQVSQQSKAPALARGHAAGVLDAGPASDVRLGTGFPGTRLNVNGLEGSPLDPRYTFESFVVGPANRMAHAGAVQVAETVFAESRGFNPLFLHSSVGHGKSHLLQAIAWEARRRTPNAKVLYLTAERFRFAFVEALKAQDAMAFKDRFRAIDMLLIDDLEFMTGEKTELEFDHIINTLLDSGRQLVVASARPPSQLTRLNDRMRSRLQRGLVTEIGAMDLELRASIVERRVRERRAADPSFELARDVIELVAEKLTESGRELEGAVNRLYAHWQIIRAPVTLPIAEGVLRDLVTNGEPRRIRIEDIQRIVSRHFGVSKNDLLSERRHRSVVWPRQIGMFLAKQMTARSLPEIGRRFGNRDHTTVLHAIRKIEGQISGNAQLKDEIEELKRQLGSDPGTAGQL